MIDCTVENDRLAFFDEKQKRMKQVKEHKEKRKRETKHE
jgi:hypothetical protein